MNPGNGIETIFLVESNWDYVHDFLLMNPGNGIETLSSNVKQVLEISY